MYFNNAFILTSSSRKGGTSIYALLQCTSPNQIMQERFLPPPPLTLFIGQTESGLSKIYQQINPKPNPLNSSLPSQISHDPRDFLAVQSPSHSSHSYTPHATDMHYTPPTMALPHEPFYQPWSTVLSFVTSIFTMLLSIDPFKDWVPSIQENSLFFWL